MCAHRYSEVTNMGIKLANFILLFLLSFSAFSEARADQVIYLIRHAEQMHDVEDPPLTDIGQQRAKIWARILRDANLKMIYTSKKRRTMQTGQPIAEALEVPMETISRKDVQGLVDRVHNEYANDAVLIISHTRTLPKLVKAFGSFDDGTINRDDYDNLFVIVPKEEDDATMLRLRYD